MIPYLQQDREMCGTQWLVTNLFLNTVEDSVITILQGGQVGVKCGSNYGKSPIFNCTGWSTPRVTINLQ